MTAGSSKLQTISKILYC